MTPPPTGCRHEDVDAAAARRDEDLAPDMPQDTGLAEDAGKPYFDCVWFVAPGGLSFGYEPKLQGSDETGKIPGKLNIRKADWELRYVVEQVMSLGLSIV